MFKELSAKIISESGYQVKRKDFNMYYAISINRYCCEVQDAGCAEYYDRKCADPRLIIGVNFRK
jgi:hypothetical protein